MTRKKAIKSENSKIEIKNVNTHLNPQSINPQLINSLSELEQKISQEFNNLSKRLQQVAKYVLDNPQAVAFETASEIAERANIPPSTLIRFANAFGFDGFNEIKKVFRSHILEETPSYTERAKLAKSFNEEQQQLNTPNDILNAFCEANSFAMSQLSRDTQKEKLAEAVKMLAEANHIYVVGLGRSFSVSSYLAYAFQHLNKRAFLIDGLGGMFKEQLSTLTHDDLLIMISFSPYAKETNTILECVNQSGAKQITITDSPLSPLVPNSDIFFVVKEAKVDAFRSHAATLCLAQTLAVSLAYHVENTKN